MRCYNCNKDFNYEKYYGICPKCGCYNKKISPEEQHWKYHDEYDGGYRHPDMPVGSPVKQPDSHSYGSGQGYVQVTETKNTSGGTVFLLISVVFIFLAVLFGSLGLLGYEEHLEVSMKEEDLEREVLTEQHELGEAFPFQRLTLTVEEARTLADWKELEIPEGKKLVAVKISGSGNGEWEDYNEISRIYIRCGGICYPQISDYEFDGVGEVYRTPSLDRYAFCSSEEAEGWVAFLVNEGARDFTMYMEELSDEEPAFLSAIHSVEIELEEGTHE